MLAAKLGLLVSAFTVQEGVTLTAEDGVSIAATHTPGKGAGKRAGVVLVHMLNGRKEDWGGFPGALAAAGFSVIAIDMRGHGKSEDTDKKPPQKRTPEEWAESLRDIMAAKGFLAGRPEIDPKRIVLIGGSIGANLCLVYAAQDRDIRGVALLSAGEDYQGVKASDALETYDDRPIFGAASDEDTYAARSTERLIDRAKGRLKNKRIYKNAGHGTRMFGNEDEKGDLTRSLIDWLKPATR